MEITIELTIDDWNRFQNYLGKKLTSSVKNITDNFWFNLIVWMILGFMFMFVFRRLSDFHWPSAGFVIGILICIAIMAFYKFKKNYRVYEPAIDGAFVGTHKYRFDEDGIHSYGKGYESKHSWEIVKSIEKEAGLIMLFIDTSAAFIIPEEKVDNPDDLFNHISDLYANITSRPSKNG